MSYLAGLSPSTLGALSPYRSHALQHVDLSDLLRERADLSGLGRATGGAVMPFEEVVDRYNKGISRAEIEAWVWYKRSVGVPMTGWESYFLHGGSTDQRVEVVGGREDVERALQPAPLTALERLAQETERILSQL